MLIVDHTRGEIATAPILSRLKPSLTDLFFFAILFVLFLSASGGWDRLVEDGDTGLHTRTGDYILDHGAVPTTDPFSYTKPGGRWFAFQWLTGVIFAGLNRAMGVKGIVLLCGTLIALTGLLMLRHMIARGATGLIAVLCVFAGINAMAIHYHARPHLFTLALLAGSHLLIAIDQRRQTRWFWMIVPLAALWSNLHSAFPVLLVSLGLLTLGEAIRAWTGESEWWTAIRYGMAAGAAALATLANPNGLELYFHISRFLNNPWILANIDEYKSPVFRSEAMYYFITILFAGLMTVRSLLERRQWAGAMWILFFGATSLVSARHIPIFTIVALPFIAVELSEVLRSVAARLGRRSIAGVVADVSEGSTARFAPVSVWAAVPVIGLLLFGTGFPDDLSGKMFPRAMVTRHAGELAEGRVFTTDQWGDYLLWRNYPRQRVFMDGRSDYFQETVGGEYVEVLSGGGRAAQILDKYGVGLVLAPVEAVGLAQVLRGDLRWELVDRDRKALLFQRRK